MSCTQQTALETYYVRFDMTTGTGRGRRYGPPALSEILCAFIIMYTLYFNHVSHIMNYDIPERYSIREWMFFDRYGI